MEEFQSESRQLEQELEKQLEMQVITNYSASLVLMCRFAEKIEGLRQKHPGFLVKLRQLGLMMGLELKDEISGPLLTKTAYDQDLLMIYANNDTRVCQLLPPLIMRPEEVDWVIERLDLALSSARRLRPVVGVKTRLEKIIHKFI